MTTIRVARRHRFTAIDRRTINDARLTFGARGLLVWLLDKPDDWTTSIERLAEASPEGRYAVRGLVKELEACGYVVRTEILDPGTKRFGVEWEVREVPDPVAETATGADPEPVAKTATGNPPTRSRKPRPEPVAKTATPTEDGLTEDETNPTPPTPPQAGGGALEVAVAFQNEQTQVLQALTGGMAEPAPQLARAMAAGGWLRLADVPDMPAAVTAWWESQNPKPLIPRREVDREARRAAVEGYHPGQFLALLCVANVATPRGLELARNRASRADLPGMSGMRGPTRGKRGQMADAGERRYQAQKEAKRKARGRGVIDADSEEVG